MAVTPGTPSFFGSNTAAATTGTMTLPTGNTGDLLITAITLGTGTAQTWTSPSGWTQVVADGASSGATNPALLSVWYKMRASGEANPSWTWSSGSVRWRAIVIGFSGANQNAPIDGTMPAMGVQSTSGTTSASAPSATPSMVDDYLLFVTGFRNTTTTTPTATPPSGMTEIAESTALTTASGVNQSSEMAGLQLSSSAATGTRTATFDLSSQSVAATVLIATARPPKQPVVKRQAVSVASSW